MAETQKTTAKASAAKAKTQKMIGTSGTSIYGGYYDEEYLSALNGKQAYDVYDEMRRSDGQVRMLLTAIKNPMKSARFSHTPKDDSEESRRIASFFDWQWKKNPFFRWGDWLTELLTFLDFGYAAHEYNFATYDHREFGLVHCLGGMGFRKQSTIERWVVKPGGGLTAIEQYAYGDTVPPGGQNVTIPAEALCLFVNDKEGDNYEGMSLLRAAYGPWFRKNHLLKMNMIGAEKAAIGTPVGTYSSAANDDDRARFEQILGNFVLHESSYLMAPKGFEVDVVKMDFDSEKLMAAIAYEDAQMSRSIMFHFLELGQNGNGGSFSLGSDLSDIALSALQYIGDMICEKMDAINERLAEWNFGDPDLAPRATCVGINQKAGKDLADTIKACVDGRLIRPDDKLEAHLREVYNLPPAETLRADDPEPPAPPPAAAGAADKGEPEETETPDAAEKPEAAAQKPDPKLSERIKFSEDGSLVSWRELTEYERPLNLAETFNEMESSRESMIRLVKTRLAGITDYVLRKLDQRLKQGPTSRIKVAAKIPIETAEYEKALLREMAKSVAMGSRQAARDLAAKEKGAKFADSMRADLEFLPPHVQEALKAQAAKQAQTHADEIKKILDYTVINADENRLADNVLISGVEDRLNEFIDSSKVAGAARTMASQAIARGRDGFFFNPENLPQIQAFQYSAVLDDRTSDVCLSLDSKIFKPGDPDGDRLRPPNHHGCRSILVPITVNEPRPVLTGLDLDPSNPNLIAEYQKRGLTPPDLQKIKKSRNL